MFFTEGLDLEEDTTPERSRLVSALMALGACVGSGVAFGLLVSGLTALAAS